MSRGERVQGRGDLRRWIGLFSLAALCVFAASLSSPGELRFSDEAYYVSSALKTLDGGRLSSATHLPEDVLARGTGHRPVHAPFYFWVLAAWLWLFPDPTDILVLNRLLFAAAAVQVHGAFLAGRGSGRGNELAGLAVLLALPLGVAYANTAMMESLVLLVGALTWSAWWRACGDPPEPPRALLAAYALATLAFLTRETLLWIPLAIAATRPRALASAHLRLWHRGPGSAAALAAAATTGAALALASLPGRGHAPNLLSELAAAQGAGAGLALVAQNLTDNLRASLSWRFFPHDWLGPYEALLLGATAALALRERGAGRGGGPAAALLALWGLTLASILLVYDATLWRSHRVLSVCTLLSTGLVLRFGALGLATRTGRSLLMVWLLALHLGLAHGMTRHFALRREAPLPPHPLRVLGLARPGDLLLSHEDFAYLLDNPRGELIWQVPRSPRQLAAVLEATPPDYALLPAEIPLPTRRYTRMDLAGHPALRERARDGDLRGLALWRRRSSQAEPRDRSQ